MPSYTYSNLKTAVNNKIHNKIGVVQDVRSILNEGVRDVVSEIDLRSTIRRASLSPNLFDDVFQYAAPSDLKDDAIIDIRAQVHRSKSEQWELTTPYDFDTRKNDNENLVAVRREGLVDKLLIAATVNDNSITISSLDSVTENGASWTAVGDAENLRQDADNYVKGAASIRYDIGSGATTTAGIQHTSLPAVDLTNYEAEASAFVWVNLSNASDITNFILRLGSSTSDYWQMTSTSTNESTMFAVGWNLLRFDFNGKTTVGTVTTTSIDYASIFMTKAVGKVSQTDFRFDHIIVSRGKIYDIPYYSKYAWQSSTGTYKENSTVDTDYLNVDTTEFNLIVNKCSELAAEDVREYRDAERYGKKYTAMKKEYQMNNPSHKMPLQTRYWDFSTISDNDDILGFTG